MVSLLGFGNFLFFQQVFVTNMGVGSLKDMGIFKPKRMELRYEKCKIQLFFAAWSILGNKSQDMLSFFLQMCLLLVSELIEMQN